MASRTKKKDNNEGIEKTGPRQIVENLPANGDAKPILPDKIEDSERIIISGAILEVEGLKKKETALQRELTLASADLIRKQDELAGRMGVMARKYSLKRGERELDMKSGMILGITQSTK